MALPRGSYRKEVQWTSDIRLKEQEEFSTHKFRSGCFCCSSTSSCFSLVRKQSKTKNPKPFYLASERS